MEKKAMSGMNKWPTFHYAARMADIFRDLIFILSRCEGAAECSTMISEIWTAVIKERAHSKGIVSRDNGEAEALDFEYHMIRNITAHLLTRTAELSKVDQKYSDAMSLSK